MRHSEDQVTTPARTGPVSKNPLVAWIERYFNGENKHRFNGFGQSNDNSHDYYNRLSENNSEITRACVTVEWAAFNEIAQDTNMIYVPCGISSGLRAHEELDKHNSAHKHEPDDIGVSTYQVDRSIGGDDHRDKVINLNRIDNLKRARIVGRTHQDAIIVAPVMREAAVRELKGREFSYGKHYEEEDFMAFWYPVIDKCKGMMLDGDWNYSRNSIWEMMRGVLIQAGEIPLRPNADMEVVDLEGHPVTLLARAQKVAETLKYQLGKGIEPREAATALAQIFTIDDEIRHGTIPAERVHESLRNEKRESEFAAMDALRAEFKPIILEHCAHYLRTDNLPDEYKKAAKTAEAAHEHHLSEPVTLIRAVQASLGETFETFKTFARGISDNARTILSVKTSPELDRKLAQVKPASERKFDSNERFFEKGARAKMFEDDLYGKLGRWEQVVLPFTIGATETGLYPNAHPMATAVFTDLKRGKVGFERAKDKSVHDLNQLDNINELSGALGREIEDIKAINAREAEDLKARLKAEDPGKIVVNTPSFLRIADTIEHFRMVEAPEDHQSGGQKKRFIAAPGPSETSPEMRLALQMKFLDRNVDRAVFQEGWEHSNDLVQLRVRARLIQAGWVERPAGPQATLDVYTANSLEMRDSLLDDITLLTKEVKRCADAHVEAPEQALALARLVTLQDLIIAPELQKTATRTTRELINPTFPSYDSLTGGNDDKKMEVCNEAKKLLIDKEAGLLRSIPLERFEAQPDKDDDNERKAAKEVQNERMRVYKTAQQAQRIFQEQKKSRAFGGSETHVDSEGMRGGGGRV